jgi:hypothetical protein
MSATERLKKGDVVLNAYAGAGYNDLHIVTGSTVRKAGPFATTKYYKTRCLFKGKLQNETLFDKASNKLFKIGHVDFEGYIEQEMEKLRKEAQ